VGEVGRLDLLAFVTKRDAGGDDMGSNPLARVADCVESPVDPRLDVPLARRRDKEEDVAFRAELDETCAEFEAGLVVVLTDVGKPLVLLAAVCVVREDRRAMLERESGCAIECGRVDQRHGDAVGLFCDRMPHRLHHLTDVAARRAGPLHVHAKERGRVMTSVHCRHEERVGQRVVDEYEPPAWVGLREGAAVREKLADVLREGAQSGGTGGEAK